MKAQSAIKKELAKQYFGKEAEEYDFARSEDPRRQKIVDIQKEITLIFLKNAGGNNILDVACGTGRFFCLYPPRKIYGLDISSDMLKQAKKRKGVKIKKLQIGDAEKIPYKDNMFDVTITSQFIMHIPNYKKVISEMTRVTKKNGSIIIDFPNKLSFSYFFTRRRILEGKLRYYNFFTKRKIYQLARENNLRINEIKGTVVFSPMLLPKFLVDISMKLNKLLMKFFPGLSYVFYIHFIKK